MSGAFELRDDTRGVAPVVGAIFIFGILVVALAIYQGSVVPSQNAEIEFDHNLRVQNDMVELRAEILRTKTTGGDGYATVELGTQYPARVFAVNPSQPLGTLSTTPAHEITVLVNGDDVSEDVFPGGDHTTRHIEYVPSYSEFADAGVLRIEHTVLYHEFEGGIVMLEGQELIRDETITIIPIQREFQTSGSRAISVVPKAGILKTTRVENPVIRLPTELDEAGWTKLLAGELDDNDSLTVNAGVLELDLDGTYTLVTAPIGLERTPASGSREVTGGMVGSGGTETWKENDTTRTISTSGGVWNGIGSVNTLVLSNPRLSPLHPVTGAVDESINYFRYALSIGDQNDGTRYIIILGENESFPSNDQNRGWMFEWDDGTYRMFNDSPVYVVTIEDGDDPDRRLLGNVSETTINDWYLEGTELNLLDPDSYEDVEEPVLTSIRTHLEEHDNQEAYIVDMTGRVDLSLEHRDD